MHPIVDLQIEYSLISRGIEDDILPTCRELGIGITAYGVLSRGLISGHWSKDRSGAQDFRRMSPRFQGGNLDANLALVEVAARDRRRNRRIAGAGRDRLGRRARQRHRAAGRRTPPRPARRGARRARREIDAGASGGARPRRFRRAPPPARAMPPRRWRISTARSVEIKAGERYAACPLRSVIVGVSPLSGLAGSRA